MWLPPHSPDLSCMDFVRNEFKSTLTKFDLCKVHPTGSLLILSGGLGQDE